MASTMSSFRACCQIQISILSCNFVTLLLLLLHRPLLSFLQPSSTSLKNFLSYSKNHLSCHLAVNATIIFHWFPVSPPVALRQYRYKPALKDEIEKQVSEMLQSGMVQPSLSAFSSPVLLVRKKDGMWRFYVDYRMLNALTVKSKFPILVVDELLDESAQARWFSCLDLRAGFNQIRLAPGQHHV